MAGLLSDYVPRLGFVWDLGQGVPKVLRSLRRDQLVVAALRSVVDPEALTRARVRSVLEQAFVHLTASVDEGAITRDGVVTWLLRVQAAGECPVASAMNGNIWVELVYRLVEARLEYEIVVPTARKQGDAHQLSYLALEVDQFLGVVDPHWARCSSELFFFCAPSLMGWTDEWDGGLEDWEEEDEGMDLADEVVEGVDNLTITDSAMVNEDGDMEMDLDSE